MKLIFESLNVKKLNEGIGGFIVGVVTAPLVVGVTFLATLLAYNKIDRHFNDPKRRKLLSDYIEANSESNMADTKLSEKLKMYEELWKRNIFNQEDALFFLKKNNKDKDGFSKFIKNATDRVSELESELYDFVKEYGTSDLDRGYIYGLKSDISTINNTIKLVNKLKSTCHILEFCNESENLDVITIIDKKSGVIQKLDFYRTLEDIPSYEIYCVERWKIMYGFFVELKRLPKI